MLWLLRSLADEPCRILPEILSLSDLELRFASRGHLWANPWPLHQKSSEKQRKLGAPSSFRIQLRLSPCYGIAASQDQRPSPGSESDSSRRKQARVRIFTSLGWALYGWRSQLLLASKEALESLIITSQVFRYSLRILWAELPRHRIFY